MEELAGLEMLMGGRLLGGLLLVVWRFWRFLLGLDRLF